jgi:alcohol dehydrogenase class IV
MEFEFATSARIIFAPGAVAHVGPEAGKMGNRAFIVTGHRSKRALPVLEQLSKHKIDSVIFNVTAEPTTTLAKSAAQAARSAKSDLVISIGGGSVIDTGKVAAAMLTNTGELEDYLEAVGAGRPLKRPCAGHIAIPTTAGTGAEVTRNAVLGVPDKKVKVSMRHPFMIPCLAVVDPVLTYSMGPALTARVGLDALTQLIEPFVSNKANPLTDGICREGLVRAGRSLRAAFDDGHNTAAREDMALASLFGGLALANAKLGAVHGLAGPLGGMISAPHGAICGALVPHVMQANVRALRSRNPDSAALGRYDVIAQLLTGRAAARAADGVKWVQELCAVLKVPTLAKLGLKEQGFAAVVAKAPNSSSMKGNPIELTEAELLEILTKAGG